MSNKGRARKSRSEGKRKGTSWPLPKFFLKNPISQIVGLQLHNLTPLSSYYCSRDRHRLHRRFVCFGSTSCSWNLLSRGLPPKKADETITCVNAVAYNKQMVDVFQPSITCDHTRARQPDAGLKRVRVITTHTKTSVFGRIETYFRGQSREQWKRSETKGAETGLGLDCNEATKDRGPIVTEGMSWGRRRNKFFSVMRVDTSMKEVS